MSIKNKLFIFLQIIGLNVVAQQKAMFSQYMFNPLPINPAYSAIDESLSITTVGRYQWTGFDGAPNTQTLSAHSPIGSTNTSVGLLAFRDQIGEALTETGGFATITQRIRIGENKYLAFGINAGISQYNANYSSIRSPIDMGDDPLFANQNDARINFGAGSMLFSEKFYLGISSPYLYTLDNNSKHSPYLMMQGGYLLNLGDAFKLKPNLLFKYVKGSPLQTDLNMNLLIKERVWLGASYRTMDSVDFLTELVISKKLSVGYAYDFTLTKLASTQNASHEVMLNFRIPVPGHNFKTCYF